MDFSEAIVAFDIKVDVCNFLKDFIYTKGQGHLLIFILDVSGSVVLFSCPLKLLGGPKSNYTLSLFWVEESLLMGLRSHN